MATPTPCACSRTRHDLRLVEDEIEALEIAAREGDARALLDLGPLRLLRERIEEHLAVLGPA